MRLDRANTTTSRAQAETQLVVLSHLRWDFVWQRPQHLISRIAAAYDSTVFVEEPMAVPGATQTSLRTALSGGIERMWLEVPGDGHHVGFEAPEARDYAERVAEQLGDCAQRTVWLYTPLAMSMIEHLGPTLVVYDVMDDLASFAHASPALREGHRRLLAEADVVFTGGRSLQRSAAEHRSDAHCLPSGVEAEHYAPARLHRAEHVRTRPVAGYVGVVDERLDLDLIAGLAGALPEWDIQIVGPVVKIDPSTLPVAPNLCFAGGRPYEMLPLVMAGFDVALMPFALNDATRSISPTKSLEYLAAGLPVVSTRVPDVVADLGHFLALADDAAGFADACRHLQRTGGEAQLHAARPLIKWNSWDAIAERMQRHLDVADHAMLSTEEATS